MFVYKYGYSATGFVAYYQCSLKPLSKQEVQPQTISVKSLLLSLIS